MKKSLISSRSILVIRPDGMGDIVLMIPFLRALRQNCPTAKITLLIQFMYLDFMRTCPYIDEVLGVHFTRIKLSNFFRVLEFSRKHLWKHRWDAALYPRWGIDYCGGAFLAFCSRASLRAAFRNEETPTGRKNRSFGFLFNCLLDGTADHHELDKNMGFLNSLECNAQNNTLELWSDPEDDLKASEALHGHFSAEQLLAVGLGGHHSSRRWSAEKWAELLTLYLNSGSKGVILLGGLDVAPLSRALLKKISLSYRHKILNLTGQCSWRLSAALIRKCSLFIGHDTGLSHIAAALDKPVVVISRWPESSNTNHPHAPERFGPRCRYSRVVRPPCNFSAGIEHIQVEQVWTALKSLKLGPID